MDTDPDFLITMTSTDGFLPHLAGSIASIREHSRDVPVKVFTDERSDTLIGLADLLRFDIEQYELDGSLLDGVTEEEREPVRSRLVKIRSMAEADSAQHLYLDADTLVLEDMFGMANEIGRRLGGDTDLFLLLNRPVPPTLWNSRHQYFKDSEIDRSGVVSMIESVYGCTVPLDVLDSKTFCWNSGIILGSPQAMRRFAGRWLDYYQRMLRSPWVKEVIPRDQLSMWLALWDHRETLKVNEMPARWNFMVGHFLGLPMGTETLPTERLTDVAVLHLAQNKSDPWARRLLVDALRRSGALDLLDGHMPQWYASDPSRTF